MTQETKQPDPLDKEIINFSFTVNQINAILQILGSAPYFQSAGLINLIQMQGEPQFRALLAKEKKNDESEKTS